MVTCLDGYQMARQGRAGPALGIAAIGSFFAGCVATIIIALFAPPLAEVALKFGPAEYFSLMVLGLIAATVLAHGSLIKAIAMVLLGLLLGLVGTDVNSGVARFSFGVSELSDGIGFVSVAMGVFGFAEIIANLEQKKKARDLHQKVSNLLPSLQDFKDSWASILRGTALGSFLGILPGGGALLASFAAYTLERRSPRTPRTSARARSRAWRRPSPRTTPARRLLSSVAHARHTVQSVIGAHDRCDDDQGIARDRR